jgi:hypothetical protein
MAVNKLLLDNIDDYFSHVKGSFLGRVCFTDKQQLHILFHTSQSTYLGIRF